MATATDTRPATCDRCGAITVRRGAVANGKDGRRLTLCPQHEREHRPALEKQGWDITPIADPDAADAGPGEQARCSRCGKLAPSRLVLANPRSKWVRVTICTSCDTRACGYGDCKERPTGPTEPKCPKGHVLMPEARRGDHTAQG